MPDTTWLDTLLQAARSVFRKDGVDLPWRSRIVLGSGITAEDDPINETTNLDSVGGGGGDPTMGGDVSGTASNATVQKVHGVTFPVGGSLTTGQVPRVTGVSTVAYGAIDLTNANAVTGALPINRGGTGLTALGTALYHLRVNGAGTALEYVALPSSSGAVVFDDSVPGADSNIVTSRVNPNSIDNTLTGITALGSQDTPGLGCLANYSSILGGLDNLASGVLSTCVGGSTNTASGNVGAICLGGFLNTASNDSACAGGQQSTASGARAFAYGDTCTASGPTSVALGEACSAQAEASVAFGYHMGTSEDAFAAFATGLGLNAPNATIPGQRLHGLSANLWRHEVGLEAVCPADETPTHLLDFNGNELDFGNDRVIKMWLQVTGARQGGGGSFPNPSFWAWDVMLYKTPFGVLSILAINTRAGETAALGNAWTVAVTTASGKLRVTCAAIGSADDIIFTACARWIEQVGL